MEVTRYIFGTDALARKACNDYFDRARITPSPEQADSTLNNFREIARYSIHERAKDFCYWVDDPNDIEAYVDGVFGRRHEHRELLVSVCIALHFSMYYLVRTFMGCKTWDIWQAEPHHNDTALVSIGDFRIVTFELENPDWMPSHRKLTDDELYAGAIELISKRGYT